MKRRMLLVAAFATLFGWWTYAQREAVEAVEIQLTNKDLLPGGKEADGILGDFILRNNRIHALISGAQPRRRANMRTENNFVTQSDHSVPAGGFWRRGLMGARSRQRAQWSGD
jgi:hypothetical protein